MRRLLLSVAIACCCLWLAESRPHADDAALADSHYKYTEERRAVIGGLATAGLIMNGLSGILGGLFGGSKDTVDAMLVGRAMRIKLSGNCATVTDLDSGYKANKCSESSQQAAALASEELVTSLIKIGIISYDDNHLRPPPVTRKPTECEDKVSAKKCQYHIKIGHCHIGSPYFHWMHEHCYMTCAACSPLDTIFPSKPSSTQG